MPCKPCCGPRLYLEGNGEPSKGFKQGSDLIRLALEEHFLNHLWIDCRSCLQLCETPLPTPPPPTRERGGQVRPSPWQCETVTGPACARGLPSQGNGTLRPTAWPPGGVLAQHTSSTLSAFRHGFQSQFFWVQFPALPLTSAECPRGSSCIKSLTIYLFTRHLQCAEHSSRDL